MTSDVHAKGRGKRSKSRSEVKTNFALFWAVPDRNSSLNTHGYEMMHKLAVA